MHYKLKFRLAGGGYIVRYYTSQDNMKWKYQLSRLTDGREKQYLGREYIE